MAEENVNVENNSTQEQGGTKCPICGSGVMKRRLSDDKKKIIATYCSNYNWQNGVNVGSCDFQIWFSQERSRFGRDLTPNDAKRLINGDTVVSPTGNKMTLDKEKKNGRYINIEYAPKQEDGLL